MAVRKLFLLNTFLALQSLGADIDYYVAKGMSATNNCGHWKQPCATGWDTIPSPFKLTNTSHNLNNWPPHDLYSGSYSLHNAFKKIQLASDLFRMNTMRCILSVCTISRAKSHSQNRRSLRIVSKHESLDTLYNSIDSLQNIKCLMVMLLLMFITCRCPKLLSFYTVILMAVSGVYAGDEYCDSGYECVGQSLPINRANGLYSRGYKSNSGSTTDITVEWDSDNYITCCGSFSCANIGYIKGSGWGDWSHLKCDGVFGCSNTSVNLTGNIQRLCYGSNSCYGATFHSYSETASIDCYGDRSC
eukprot:230177_1